MRPRARRPPRGLKLPLSVYFPDLPTPTLEYQFALDIGRKWRFDAAWVSHMVAIEQDGGLWVQGRHSRGAGMLKDNEKMNDAAIRGWRVGRFSPQQVRSGVAAAWVRLALGPAPTHTDPAADPHRQRSD